MPPVPGAVVRHLRWSAPLLLLLAGCTGAHGTEPLPSDTPSGARRAREAAQAWRTAAAQAMSTTRKVPLEDETCRQVLRTTVTGRTVRLRLSNALTPAPLTLTAVTVGLRRSGAGLVRRQRPSGHAAGRPHVRRPGRRGRRHRPGRPGRACRR